MTRQHRKTTPVGWFATFAIAFLLSPVPVAAHCDSLDGPVVEAARSALGSGNVDLALVWVRPEDEAEVREAFARTLEVRSLGGSALAMADLWFFETVVRVHRQGEGAPYTGLKPAGQDLPDGIAAADRALESGSVDHLARTLAQLTESVVHERFQAVIDSQGHRTDDLTAGRHAVGTYVEFIHLVETLHALLSPTEGHGHSSPEARGRLPEAGPGAVGG